MDRDRDVYYKKWFDLRIEGKNIRAQCIDIEFEGIQGPLFLMKGKGPFAQKFWLTRRELRQYTIIESKG